MNNQEVITICHTTYPLLEANEQDIVTNFYNRLYNHTPSLIKGHEQQSINGKKDLAQSIYSDLTNSESIKKVLDNKEVSQPSWPISPEHYPIIGIELLAAIQDKLGAQLDDTAGIAWQQAFENLLESFVEDQMENDHHSEEFVDEDGFQKLVVTKKETESKEVISLYLKTKNGLPLDPFKAGQHVRIKVTLPNENESHIRYFSLSDSPDKDYYRVTIKKELNKPEGMLTPTNYLYDSIEVGDSLFVSPPAGDFILNQSSKDSVMLLSGGVGLTPLVSMYNTLIKEQPTRDVIFVHATENSSTHTFKEAIASSAEGNDHVSLFTCYERPTDRDRDNQQFNLEGYITLESIKSLLPDEDHRTEFYFCGPTPFMKAVYTALKELGVEKERIHYEYYGPGSLEEL